MNFYYVYLNYVNLFFLNQFFVIRKIFINLITYFFNIYMRLNVFNEIDDSSFIIEVHESMLLK